LPSIPFPGNVKAADTITGSFGYIGSQFTGNSITGNYTFSGSAPLGQSFSLNVATPGTSPLLWSDSYGANGALYSIFMRQPSAGVTTLEVDVSTIGGSGVAKPGAFVELFLTSTTYTGGKTLPTATTIGNFLTTKATLTWDPPGGPSFTADIDNFNGVQVVPEPSSLVLGLIAMVTGTAGLVISRHERKADSGIGRRDGSPNL
jgi:hypothetical protein